MVERNTKRPTYTTSAPDPAQRSSYYANIPEVEAIPSTALRVRMAVSNGYANPHEAMYEKANVYNETQQQYALQGYANVGVRVPLPSHMSGPPSLSGPGSTLGSSGSFSEWDSKLGQGPVQNLDTPRKRKLDDDEASEPSLITFDYDF